MWSRWEGWWNDAICLLHTKIGFHQLNAFFPPSKFNMFNFRVSFDQCVQMTFKCLDKVLAVFIFLIGAWVIRSVIYKSCSSFLVLKGRRKKTKKEWTKEKERFYLNYLLFGDLKSALNIIQHKHSFLISLVTSY